MMLASIVVGCWVPLDGIPPLGLLCGAGCGREQESLWPQVIVVAYWYVVVVKVVGFVLALWGLSAREYYYVPCADGSLAWWQ
jgi:hypothetical protein